MQTSGRHKQLQTAVHLRSNTGRERSQALVCFPFQLPFHFPIFFFLHSFFFFFQLSLLILLILPILSFMISSFPLSLPPFSLPYSFSFSFPHSCSSPPLSPSSATSAEDHDFDIIKEQRFQNLHLIQRLAHQSITNLCSRQIHNCLIITSLRLQQEH